MSELTDLEINTKIAELEGVIGGDYHPINNYKHKDNLAGYKSKANLYDLMVKYKVEIEYILLPRSKTQGQCFIGSYCKHFNDISEIPRAICLCILESKGLL